MRSSISARMARRARAVSALTAALALPVAITAATETASPAQAAQAAHQAQAAQQAQAARAAQAAHSAPNHPRSPHSPAARSRAARSHAARSRAARSAAARAASEAGWRLAVTRHYGSVRDASGYSAVVAAPDGSDVWAFGGTNPGGTSAPVALRLAGSHWRSWRLPAGLPGFISAASEPSGRDIWAVGNSGGYVLHWNGSRWAVAKRWAGGGTLTGVTAVSPADVWVFGTTTAGTRGLGTWHFNGRSWTRVTGRAVQIYQASAVSGRDIWAVAATREGGYIEHFNGRTWLRVDAGRALDKVSLDDVLAVSRHDVWVVGNLTARRSEGRLVLAHFNGRRWRTIVTTFRADTGRLAADGSGGLWLTADTAGVSAKALIGHLPAAGSAIAWTTAQHGLGTGISDIAVSRRTGAAWLSGGFLTRAGGDAAIWSRPGAPQFSGAALGFQLRPGAPLNFQSRRLDLAALLWRQRPAIA